MIALMGVFLAVLFAPAENIEVKIGLGTAVVAAIAGFVAYAYGVEAARNMKNKDQEGN